ncbi:helix-turn-helix transcriptional regulator [Nonomuraea sp. NPDC003754]
MTTKLGMMIRSARLDLGLTQTALARDLGVSQGMVSRLEKGEKYPTGDLTQRLSAALKIDIFEIFDLAVEMSDPVEHAIVKSGLSPEKQDVVLAVYGLAAGRDSLGNVALLRSKLPEGRQGQQTPNA